jgi:hypothetical protein
MKSAHTVQDSSSHMAIRRSGNEEAQPFGQDRREVKIVTHAGSAGTSARHRTGRCSVA